jgi:predicted dehydrogenase
MSQHKTKDEVVRYGVIGLGHIAQVAMLPAFEQADNSELVALFSSDRDKLDELGDRYGVTHRLSYDDFDAFLERGLIDALYIALPNHLHCDYTVRAAERGVHVLCEKPMAVTQDECLKMIEACEANDVRLMIAYRLHFEEANLEAIRAIERGDIGEPRFFVSAFSQDVREKDVRLYPLEKGGGTVYDMGIYCINAARYLFRDEPVEVVAMSESKEEDERFDDSEEMTSVILRFPQNRLATFTSSFGASSVSSYRVIGTEGDIALEPAYGYAVPLHYEIESRQGIHSSKTLPKRDQFGPQLVYFSNCILEGKRPEPDGYEGLADVRIIEAIYTSAKTGEPVAIDPVEKAQRPDISQKIIRPGLDKPPEVKVSSPGKD